MNLKDPRFDAIFSDHNFNIDPSDQLYKKTKAMETILNEKIKRIQNNEIVDKNNNQTEPEETDSNNKQSDPHISLMVKSIKSKAEILKRKKEEINNIKKKLRLNNRN